MTRHAIQCIVVLLLATFAHAADQPDADKPAAPAENEKKPAWRESGPQVFVFGKVQRAGVYTLNVGLPGIPDRPLTLRQIVVAAGMPADEETVVILHRPTGKTSKLLHISAERLEEDGNIKLEVNDVIHVVAKQKVN